ncbi:SusC/RagA family TonB-linked outer membrane protein [Pinibacter aurantiacus]|uniref:SusC/RagA family TonB-linked outer membrane protein n=1 Tax=Pinibacter aurantiacus TaxID=2851599 RepID=A0A9E2W7V4_9BACT|nr:SusC/RagA family TonB-linked outer membrane protein [Pinibacter aurantiacus]MBV4357331.1 SusC/RagA family TonB-linked outer membrane protein [Pinibacter aurantiacus]
MHVAAYGRLLPERLCQVPSLKQVVGILFVCLALSAKSANAQKISLSVNKQPLEKVFALIEEQSSFHFFYTREDMASRPLVSIHLKNASINSVLDACFKNIGLTYQIEDHYITIKSSGRQPESNQKDSLQLLRVTGIVSNEQGEALPGATIQIKGSQTYQNTDNKGNFVIDALPKGAVLIISSVGYVPQEITIIKENFSHVFLKVAVAALDETIVIAYGTTTRRLNTGAVGRLTANEISKQPVANPLGALEGRITGLQITQSNGLPGSNFKVLIRGMNSIQSGTDPLYIIDGVPFLNNVTSFSKRSGLVANSPFNNIDPSTIESIEVLKDADATAIYGSRGANGVILITTKKYKEGGTHLSFTYAQNFSKVRNSMGLMNTPTYLMMRREAFKNDAIEPDETNAPDLLVWDTSRYNDWRKMLIGKTALSENAQVQLSGGNANTKFGFGLGYLNDGTVFTGNFFDRRINGNVFVAHQSLDKRFNFNFSSSYTDEETHLPQQDMTAYIYLPPNMYAPYDSTGALQWQDKPGTISNGNPYGTLQQPYNTSTDRFTATGIISYKFFDHLTLKTSLGYNQFLFNENAFYPISSQDPSYLPQGSNSFGISSEKIWNIEPQIEYNNERVGKKGKLAVLLGTTFQESIDKSQVTDGYGYNSDLLLKSINAAPNIVVNSTSNQYHYNALFARINYNWSGKYLINATGRRDGSSRFGPGKQFANFGAIGAAWIFSEEQFVQNKLPFLSFGKLRGSYGITGNDRIGNYQYLDTYVITRYPYQGQPALRPSRLYNPDFSWENNIKGEIAVEFGFLKNRIMLNAAWFKNRSTNQIIQYSLPGQTGATSILMNFPGVVSNKGWEIELQTVNIRKSKFDWKTAFNISITKNSLDKFPGLESSSYATRYQIGEPLNLKRGYQFLGVDPENGVYRFNDLNKDGIINTGDYITIGTTDPSFYGGLLNTFRYRNWQLDIHLQFVKQKGIDPVYGSYSTPGLMANQSNLVLDRWQAAGDLRPYQLYSQDYSGAAVQATDFVNQSSAILTDASFIRLKNISIQYSLNDKLLSRVKLASAQVFLQAQNLATITSYKGLDPESKSTTTLPPLVTIAAGVKLSF